MISSDKAGVQFPDSESNCLFLLFDGWYPKLGPGQHVPSISEYVQFWWHHLSMELWLVEGMAGPFQGRLTTRNCVHWRVSGDFFLFLLGSSIMRFQTDI